MTTPPDQFELKDDTIRQLTRMLDVLKNERAIMRHTLTEQLIDAVGRFLDRQSETSLAAMQSAYDRYANFNRSLLIGFLVVLLAATGSSAGMIEIPDQRFEKGLWLRDIRLSAASDPVFYPRIPVPARAPVQFGPLTGPIELTATVDATALAGTLEVIGGVRFDWDFTRYVEPWRVDVNIDGRTNWAGSEGSPHRAISAHPRYQNWPYGQTEVPLTLTFPDPVELDYLTFWARPTTLWIPEPSAVLLALMAALAAWRFAR